MSWKDDGAPGKEVGYLQLKHPFFLWFHTSPRPLGPKKDTNDSVCDIIASVDYHSHGNNLQRASVKENHPGLCMIKMDRILT